jgi:glycosyltransferase involved in cell wall biosynthesis
MSCVVPAYNEAASLPFLWSALRPVMDAYADWEVIFVSDGSTDNTVNIVRDIASHEPRVRLVELRRNQGKSTALTAGFSAATGDVVVTLDADLQDDPLEIPKLIAALGDQNVDMVGGWKQNRHDPIVKVISSRVFNALANRAMKTHFRDLNCGLKAYRTDVVRTLDLYGDMYRFIPLLATAQGWRAIELPVSHKPREHGISKYGLRLNGAFDLISILLITRYRWRPLHFFGRWGAFFVGVGVAILIYLTVLHFMGQAIGDRPLLIFGLLFVLTGFQLFFTGLLGDLILQQRSKK